MERWPGSLGVSDRVLIVRLGAVGDVLRVLPAARRMRAALPGLVLDWIVEPLSAPLLEGHPDLDEVILFPRRDLRPDPARPTAFRRAWRDLATRLRGRAYSVAIDFQGSFKSGLVTRVSGAPRRVGFRPGETRELSFLFTNEWVTLSAPRLNRVDRNLEACAALGVRGGPTEAFLPERPDEAADAERILASLPAGGARVVVSPGTSRRQAYKAWPASHYAALARTL
ncbi:MAG TPA: glycosyltransferase family 9 protein, partial [Candidatus Polarisedimenticolia bacterium]|nr:glycosyltransferase family 9 protein [Candidatus Polarisedimenticolia bacterium]